VSLNFPNQAAGTVTLRCDNVSFDIATPEPSSVMLAATILAILAAVSRKRAWRAIVR
jgi:hypothetical protein